MGPHWSRLGWGGLGRGWVWAVMFVPPVRPETAYEPAQVLTTVPEKLALHPSPTVFLLHLFFSPDLGLSNLEK